MRGFTLIELLAVIVILSVVLLISVPLINNILEGVRKSTFESSVENIVKSGEYTYAKNLFKPSRELVYTFANRQITGNFPDAKLEFSGEVPISGNLIIRKDGKIATSLFNGVYCATKDYNETRVTISDVNSADCYSEISLPQLVILGQNPQYIEVNEVFVEDGATAVGVFGDPISNIAIEYKLEENVLPTIDTTVIGTYRAIYTVVEDGKTNFVERSVIVRDTIKPVLNIPASTNIVINEVNTFDFLAGVSVTDNSLETLTVQISGSIARIAGSYAITYSATDSSGNTEEVIRMINVTDIEAPVLTINGTPVINLNIGDTYSELGATALDDADSNLTSSIITSGSVNTSTPGTYFIIYTVTDSSNNESSITRTVNVIDNVAPIVTFGTNGNATYAKTRSTTVSVTDNVSVTSRYYQWTTSTAAPLTGTFTQSFVNGAVINAPAGVSGSYYLWIKAVDSTSNEAITRSNVFNLDNTAPVVTSIVSDVSNLAATTFTMTRTGNATDVNGGLAVSPYIYQTSLDNSNWTTRCTNNAASCAVTGLAESTTYYYRICTVDVATNQSCIASKTIKTPRVGEGQIVDARDGKIYRTQVIGTQTWFTDNLAYTPASCLAAAWQTVAPFNACRISGGAGWNKDEVHYQWGALMNGSTTEGAQGLCPTGFRVPTDNDWKTLEKFMGMTQTEADKTNAWRGTNEGQKMKSLDPSWNGLDTYGFNIKPTGARGSVLGDLMFNGTYGQWWNSTATNAIVASNRMIFTNYATIYQSPSSKAAGYSARCVMGG